MIYRSFDAFDINGILNAPEVFDAIKLPGIETFDVTGLISNPANVLMVTDGGGVIFVQDEPGIYEVHTAFLEAHRGAHALKASLEAYRWMFTNTDCMILQTKVPAFNVAADRFCAAVGAKKQFVRIKSWPRGDDRVDVTHWTLPYDDWVRQTKVLLQSGQSFHDKLDREFVRLGVDREAHADEECHDRYVGACVETIYGGQVEKAIVLYNRWARFAGYRFISMTSRSPLMIDIGEAVLQVSNHDFTVIKCR